MEYKENYECRNTIRKRKLQKRMKRRRRRIRLLKFSFCILFLLLLVFSLDRGLLKKVSLFGHSHAKANVSITHMLNEDEMSLLLSDSNLSILRDLKEEEVMDILRQLAQKDERYQTIYDQSDKYPSVLLKSLCNNSEMIDFVLEYSNAHKVSDRELTSSEKAQEIPLLLQWDQRWGYENYGSSNIGLAGCAPTCLSMVIIGLTKQYDMTPDIVAKYAEENGYYYEGTGTSWALMNEGCNYFHLQGTQICLDESVLDKHLAQGEPVICSVGPGYFTVSGHFIVITEKNDKGYRIHDPNSRKRSEVIWDYDTLSKQIKNLWAFQAQI